MITVEREDNWYSVIDYAQGGKRVAKFADPGDAQTYADQKEKEARRGHE